MASSVNNSATRLGSAWQGPRSVDGSQYLPGKDGPNVQGDGILGGTTAETVPTSTPIPEADADDKSNYGKLYQLYCLCAKNT